LLYLLNASQGNIFIIVSSQNSIIFKFQGTLYTGLLDGRIVKLEGDKVIDVVQTGKPPCGKWHIFYAYYLMFASACACVSTIGLLVYRIGPKTEVRDIIYEF